MVKVPTALGMFKPVILMPLGMMAKLPPDQVEAVPLHELAHIRRRDFLVNLVQHFAETIFSSTRHCSGCPRAYGKSGNIAAMI